MPSLDDTVRAYRQKFGDAPTIVGLPSTKDDEMVAVLEKAMAGNTPFKTDADFLAAIGMRPPPEGAVI